MIIKRKKSSIYFKLVIAIFLLTLISSIALHENGEFKIYYLAFIFLAIYDIIVAFYNYRTPLISFSNDEIMFYNFPNKTTSHPIRDISIQYIDKEYIFTTNKGDVFKILKSKIPQNQLNVFEDLIHTIDKQSRKATN